MIYQGDTYCFVLNLMQSDGTAPTVTTSPTLQIINCNTGASVLGTPGALTLLSGSTTIYSYNWNISTTLASGDYLAVVSYVANSVVWSGKYLEKIRVGDSRVVAVVAQDLTVAKDATVAKDTTVAHLSDLASISPDNSVTVLAIKAKTDNLPSDPTSTTTLTSMNATLTDVWNASLGNIYVDQSTSPATLSIIRPSDNSTLAVYNLSESGTITSKVKQ